MLRAILDGVIFLNSALGLVASRLLFKHAGVFFLGWALRFEGGFGKEEFICMTHKVTEHYLAVSVLTAVLRIIKDSLHAKQKQASKHLPKSDFSPLICCPHCCFFFSNEIKKTTQNKLFPGL